MKNKIKIISLGGINEIGKNMMLIEYLNEVVVVDCGLAFPNDKLFGVDCILPDINYLKKIKNKIKAILITHGHEDHIGALPYLLREINAPIFCTRLTAGLIEVKLSEHKINCKIKINIIKSGDIKKICNSFITEFIHTNHSIADSIAIAIKTPIGTIIHTGDFKIDATPVSGKMIDLTRFGELGKDKVLLLMSDSTNAERRGYSMSELKVGDAIDRHFKNCSKRIIVATFASNIYRIQQIVNSAYKYGRKVAISGRSMENIIYISTKLKYLDIPRDILIETANIKKIDDEKLVIISTGSQGEEMSALNRMAFGEHKQIELSNNDKIIIAASAIPGNEKHIYGMINELCKRGSEIIYDDNEDIHVSGHACQEELKIMLSLIRPKFFIPIHGEHRHLKKHAEIAEQTGILKENIPIIDVGVPIEFSEDSYKILQKINYDKIFVDGDGIGDINDDVINDRKHLSENGIVLITVDIDYTIKSICNGPNIISRGFINMDNNQDFIDEIRKLSIKIINKYMLNNDSINKIKLLLQNLILDFIYYKTKRSPMVVALITKNK